MVDNRVHERLENLLLDHGEHDQPIAFAGRESIFRSITRVVERLSVKPLKGQTFIIGGAPGAGKTSFAEELKKRLAGNCIVQLEVPDEQGTQALWMELAEKLTGKTPEELRAIRYEEIYGQGGISQGARGEIGHGEGTTIEPPPLKSCRQILRLAREPPKAPVVVCIDEIQGAYMQRLTNADLQPAAPAIMQAYRSCMKIPALGTGAAGRGGGGVARPVKRQDVAKSGAREPCVSLCI